MRREHVGASCWHIVGALCGADIVTRICRCHYRDHKHVTCAKCRGRLRRADYPPEYCLECEAVKPYGHDCPEDSDGR